MWMVDELASMPRRYWTAITCMLSCACIYLLVLLIWPADTTVVTSTVKADQDLSYGIVIDAGSTGSRLFLYAFTSGSEKELISVKPVKDEFGVDVIRKVTPGLSSFEKKPEDAPGYYKPLLEYASKYIPTERQPFTPVFIFATAGMRLIPQDAQDKITAELRTNLPKLTKLQILPEHIQVIDGKWEGIYSWIAVNYVLGRFNVREDGASGGSTVAGHVSRDKTAGMIDMGGASVQIAFELPQTTDFSGASMQAVNLGCVDEDRRFRYNLFVTTFLGFGVNEGAKKFEKVLNTRLLSGNHSALDPVPYITDNCLPLGYLRLSSADDGSQYVRTGTGEWDECVGDLVKVLKGAGDCTAALKCFFGGVEAPKVDLSSMELYGFSEYWYSSQDVLSLGGRYNHDEFEKMARKFCGTRWKQIKKSSYPTADQERLEGQCFKSAWIHAVLHDGFHVNELNHQFQSALRIRNQEVQWALGALIYQMRYYPLRDAQRNAFKALHPATSSALYPLLYIIGAFLVFAVLLGLAARYFTPKHSNNGRFRRDAGAGYSYRKLADDLFQPSFRHSQSTGQLPI